MSWEGKCWPCCKTCLELIVWVLGCSDVVNVREVGLICSWSERRKLASRRRRRRRNENEFGSFKGTHLLLLQTTFLHAFIFLPFVLLYTSLKYRQKTNDFNCLETAQLNYREKQKLWKSNSLVITSATPWYPIGHHVGQHRHVICLEFWWLYHWFPLKTTLSSRLMVGNLACRWL